MSSRNARASGATGTRRSKPFTARSASSNRPKRRDLRAPSNVAWASRDSRALRVFFAAAEGFLGFGFDVRRRSAARLPPPDATTAAFDDFGALFLLGRSGPDPFAEPFRPASPEAYFAPATIDALGFVAGFEAFFVAVREATAA